MTDVINHPAHYKAQNGLEAIDVIEGFGLGFHLGNVVKYVLRSDRKGATVQDLQKADWYLRRQIASLEAAQGRAPNDLRRYSLCYLATPYSKYKAGLDKAFEDAAALAAVLLVEGVKVYSPIAHTHPLAKYSHLDPLDHEIWLPFDEAMMTAADALIVVHMDGWEESYGIAHEIKFFAEAGKPIYDLDPKSLALTRRPS
jgi:hypothetical protein